MYIRKYLKHIDKKRKEKRMKWKEKLKKEKKRNERKFYEFVGTYLNKNLRLPTGRKIENTINPTNNTF